MWHKTLQRRWRLVVLLTRQAPAKPRFIVRGSTDPDLNGHKLVELYAARFQIEFLFRDSKQFTGLLDCQARAASALDFHFNASLATLNLVRAEDLCMQPGQEPHVFSMASWKQCQCNERLLDVCMKQLALAPTWVKNPDFSVVLFRPHFMLASEGYPMKVHKNQRLLTLPSPLNLPYGATNQDTYHGVWWTGCLRSDLTGDDPQRCGLTNS